MKMVEEIYNKQKRIKQNNKKKWICLAIYLIYIAFIFANSLDPADVSSTKSGAVLQFLNHVLFADRAILTEHCVRKLAHFTEYAGAGILGGMAFSQWIQSRGQRLIDTCFAGLLVAFCDETIQLFVPGRSGQVSDMWIDVSGYLLGAVCMFFVLWLLKRYRKSGGWPHV